MFNRLLSPVHSLHSLHSARIELTVCDRLRVCVCLCVVWCCQEYIEPRSTAFIGKRLWARRYAERKQLDWGEVTFDTEMNAYVVYTPDSQPDSRRNTQQQQAVNARVINKYRDEQGRLLYDIQLEDGDKEVKAVTNDQLEVATALSNTRTETHTWSSQQPSNQPPMHIPSALIVRTPSPLFACPRVLCCVVLLSFRANTWPRRRMCS